ncbi:MAG: hypothetical protein QNJ75_08360 [Acidimicrobiia bacterium]|nr:hypothetical protein [Acidimicrobiia bacterium]
MDRRTLQMIQRGLTAAVSVVLALIVITSFRNLLEPPGATQAPSTTAPVAAAGDTDETPTETTVEEPGSGEDGSDVTQDTVTTTTAAVAIPAVCLEEPPEENEGTTVLRVFFPCGGTDLARGTYVYRVVPATDLVLTTTMREMTAGLDLEETQLGFRNPLPASADGSFQGVSIVDGTAYIEFGSNDILPPGVATIEGAQVFLSTLNANVFQFSSISAVEYRLNGSCDAFWQQIGAEECDPITRAEWSAQLG